MRHRTHGKTQSTSRPSATSTGSIRPSDPYPIRLFDGTNRIAKYRLVPFEQRLEYKDSPNTAVYDQANKQLYLNGTVPARWHSLHPYIKSTADFDSNSDPIWLFPDWAHILIAFFTVGLHKGGVDYDDVNARMAPDNRASAELTVKMLENWDNELELAEQEGYERYERSDGWRPDHINL